MEDTTVGKFPTGIDWTDVAVMMNAVGAAHTARIDLVITTGGQGHNGRLEVHMNARFDVLPGSDLPKVVTVTGTWPSTMARSFDGLCYNLLWQLDYAIQQAYQQMRLEDAQPSPGHTS